MKPTALMKPSGDTKRLAYEALRRLDNLRYRVRRLSIFNHNPRRSDHNSRLRVVVIVERGRRGLGLDAVARLEFKRELQAAGSRPQVSDHAVRQNIVVIQAPPRFLSRLFERFAVDVGARRQADLREHHSITLMAITVMADTFGSDIANDLFAGLHFEFVVIHSQSQGARIAESEVFAPLSRALLPRLVMRFDNLRRRPSGLARAPDFNAVVSPAEGR